MLYSGKCKTVNEAAAIVGISRSAFYKYKDSVSVYLDDTAEHIISFNLLLTDRVGHLSGLLTLLSDFGASILTINQNIPANDIAPVSISLSTKGITCSVDELFEIIKNAEGVLRVDLLTKI